MIHIDPQPEPPHFDARVRTRGMKFLARHPNPTKNQWKSHDYWTEVLESLYTEYKGICAYSCHWIAPDTGSRTVEHFHPKSKFPPMAYEWSNYRLVCLTLNRQKGIQPLLDPFEIGDGWFIIDFPSLLVKPSSEINVELQKKVSDTIAILGLNDEGTCMKNRLRYVRDYCEYLINFQFMRRDAPFLARELHRQDLSELVVLRRVMGY